MGVWCIEDAGYEALIANIWTLLNSEDSPVQGLLFENMEQYQRRAGLATQPFETPIPPPKTATSITAQAI